MLKSFRYLLFPFALLHWIVLVIRNWMYDIKLLQGSSFNFPVISVGNLALGGTGKTPMIEYLIRRLSSTYRVATLSRGYRRRTRGFTIADDTSTALEIGDEPMQVHVKHPGVTVAVGEERVVAIPQILYQKPDTQVILLDDAFQHRAVRAGLSILLTEYGNPYSRDLLFPCGDLRDIRRSARRADMIIVTKCPSDLSVAKARGYREELRIEQQQTLFFTTLDYGQPYHLFHPEKRCHLQEQDVLLICGIANPEPLKHWLTGQARSFDLMRFPDHHIFSMQDLRAIRQQFDAMPGREKCLLTTEKDAVRLIKFGKELERYPLYVIPVTHRFLFDEAPVFDQRLIHFIEGYSKPTTTTP